MLRILHSNVVKKPPVDHTLGALGPCVRGTASPTVGPMAQTCWGPRMGDEGKAVGFVPPTALLFFQNSPAAK
jgi:hypothetical protein